MPFIITTKPDACPEGMEGCRCVGHTSHAVATIDEAREAAYNFVNENMKPGEERVSPQIETYSMPETGGTIGPLPDGTTIEVERVTWPELRDRANLTVSDVAQAISRDDPTGQVLQQRARDHILDAYNERQEG